MYFCFRPDVISCKPRYLRAPDAVWQICIKPNVVLSLLKLDKFFGYCSSIFQILSQIQKKIRHIVKLIVIILIENVLEYLYLLGFLWIRSLLTNLRQWFMWDIVITWHLQMLAVHISILFCEINANGIV